MVAPSHLLHYGVKQGGLFASGGVNLLFPFIAHGHEFVYFDDDAVLFGEGREGTKVCLIFPTLRFGCAEPKLALNDAVSSNLVVK